MAVDRWDQGIDGESGGLGADWPLGGGNGDSCVVVGGVLNGAAGAAQDDVKMMQHTQATTWERIWREDDHEQQRSGGTGHRCEEVAANRGTTVDLDWRRAR